MILIFLDGVGIGRSDEKNPFYVAGCRYLPFYEPLPQLPDGTPIKPIDTMLGVEGLPQSATGQTALFTGVNAPALLGKHWGSYPNQALRKIIKEKNILSQLRARGLEAGFINVYPFSAALFGGDHVEIRDDGSYHFSHEFPELYKRRISVTTCMMIANGLIPFGERDLMEGRAIYQEYSNHSINHHLEKMRTSGELAGELARRGVKAAVSLPEFTPEEAADILYNTSADFDFLIYEYFQTDIYAHRHSFEERVQLVRDLDCLIARLITQLDPHRDTFILTSDHGNIEDGTSLAHTLNPVPFIAWGRHAEQLRTGTQNLTQITPSIIKIIGSK